MEKHIKETLIMMAINRRTTYEDAVQLLNLNKSIWAPTPPQYNQLLHHIKMKFTGFLGSD